MSASRTYARSDHEVVVLKLAAELQVGSEVFQPIDQLVQRHIDGRNPNVIVMSER